MGEKLPATITMTGLKLREARELADQHGGEIEMTGLMTWQWVFHGSLTEQEFEELRERFGGGEQ